MTTHFPQLAGEKTEAFRFAHLIHRPGHPITHNFIEFEGLGFAVRRFLALLMSPELRAEAPRTLVVQGAPGTGKSEGALVAVLGTGHAAAVVSSSMFASEVEGGATALLDDLFTELERWSHQQRMAVTVIINDIDLSIMARDEKTGVSSNTNLLLEKFHYLADNRHLFSNYDGSTIGFVVTVNDATALRASLYRTGRATWFDHEPTEAERINIAWAILAPRTADERRLIQKLTRRYRRQSVNFWKALRLEIRTEQMRPHRATGEADLASLSRALSAPIALAPDLVWACARRLDGARVRSWLPTLRAKS